LRASLRPGRGPRPRGRRWGSHPEASGGVFCAAALARQAQPANDNKSMAEGFGEEAFAAPPGCEVLGGAVVTLKRRVVCAG